MERSVLHSVRLILYPFICLFHSNYKQIMKDGGQVECQLYTDSHIILTLTYIHIYTKHTLILTCAHILKYAHIHNHKHAYSHAHSHTDTYSHTFSHTLTTHIHTLACNHPHHRHKQRHTHKMPAYLHTHAHIYTHSCTHLPTYIHMHIHTHIPRCFRSGTNKSLFSCFILCIIKDKRPRENKLKFKVFLQNNIQYSF